MSDIISILVAVSGWAFAIFHSRTERWWELKVSAYREIIKSLYDLKIYWRYREGETDEAVYYPSNPYSDSTEEYEMWLKERENKVQDEKYIQHWEILERKSDKAIEIIKRNTATASFIINKQARIILEDFVKKYDQISSEYKAEQLYEEMYTELCKTSEECLINLMIVAEDDLLW